MRVSHELATLLSTPREGCSNVSGGVDVVTTFNRYAPYYASNPSVAPDGRRLAFQLSVDGDTEGQGDGLLVLDLTAP